MTNLLSRTLALKPTLRQAIFSEWSEHGFFPCYATILLRGDPTLGVADLKEYVSSRVPRAMKMATALCWPFRAMQLLPAPPRDGIATRVPTRSRTTLRFHTFFTDAYFYEAIRRMVVDKRLPVEARRRGARILVDLISAILGNELGLEIAGEEFKVYQFFPAKDLRLDASSGARFLRLSGLDRVQADADDTFVLLEVFDDFLRLLQGDALVDVDAARKASMAASLAGILDRPYWKLARFYQFRTDGVSVPHLNYIDVDPLGGISTWFGRAPNEAPDLVVNVNVLRSLLANRARWGVLESPDALDVARRIVGFLWRNVQSNLFRSERGHAFYLPEVFCAMFARLFRVFKSLDAAERHAVDPEGSLRRIRRAVLSYIEEGLNPGSARLNTLDAALAVTSAVRLGASEELISPWLQVIDASFQERPPHYFAYEIFKGKIPAHMVYGSEAMTTAFVYEALHEIEAAAARAVGGEMGLRAASG